MWLTSIRMAHPLIAHHTYMYCTIKINIMMANMWMISMRMEHPPIAHHTCVLYYQNIYIMIANMWLTSIRMAHPLITTAHMCTALSKYKYNDCKLDHWLFFKYSYTYLNWLFCIYCAYFLYWGLAYICMGRICASSTCRYSIFWKVGHDI